MSRKTSIPVDDREAVASNVRLHIDVPQTDISKRLERWDNEGGAIKKNLSDQEQREVQHRIVNDTVGTRRRANETHSLNRLI